MHWKSIVAYSLGLLSISAAAQSTVYRVEDPTIPIAAPANPNNDSARQYSPGPLTANYPRAWYEAQHLQWLFYQGEHQDDAYGYVQNYLALRNMGTAAEEVPQQLLQTMADNLPGHPAHTLLTHWHTQTALGNAAEFWAAHQTWIEAYGLQGPMISMADLEGDKALEAAIYTQWALHKNQDANVLYLQYNLLASVAQDGFLLLPDEAMYWSLKNLQQQFGYRPDLTLIYTRNLLNADYCARLSAEHGFRPGALATDDPLATRMLKEEDRAALAFLISNPDKQLHLPLWSSSLMSNLKSEPLYMVGLTMQLSAEDIDNLATIRQRMEEEFVLDYLQVEFTKPNATDAAMAYERHYLLPMYLLVRQLDASGEATEANAWWELMQKVWARLGKDLPLETQFDRLSVPEDVFSAVNNNRPHDLDVEAYEESMKPVGNNLYAHEHELSNAAYGVWLDYLEKNGEEAAWLAAKSKLTGAQAEEWEQLTPYYFTGHPAFDEYPVVGVSQQAAIAYCEWLTAQYHLDSDRKYKKVRFRLPTEEEWFLAATGINKYRMADDPTKVEIHPTRPGVGRKYMVQLDIDTFEFRFPWWGHFAPEPAVALNERGCWVGNYDVVDLGCGGGRASGDGYRYTAVVNGYFPNYYELFNMSGNVAEMVAEAGVAKGGSWGHTPEESYLFLQQEYSGTDYRVGFRVFMEVIEE